MSGGFTLDGRMVNNSGVLELNGLNTFTGNVSIVTGQINANTLADSGVASSLGAGSSLSTWAAAAARTQDSSTRVARRPPQTGH